MGPEEQVLAVLAWLVLIRFLQLSLYPLLRAPLGRFAYPASFPASILAFSAFAWYLGLLGLPVALAVLPFLGVLLWAALTDRYRWEDLKPQLRWDLVFFAAFLALLAVRLGSPDIWGAEKFMDHAFIASVMRSPVVPPVDPWYAGGVLDVYYYGGYWLVGVLGILTGVPSPVVFNLALPTAFALAAVSLYAVGDLLLARFRWLPLLVLVLVNPAFLGDLLSGGGLSGLLWDSTRVITNTINEYTLFSFLWGDVHPHVVGIFNQCFLLLLLALALKCWYRLGLSGRVALAALAALSLGSMPVMNTWDILVYAPLFVIVALLVLWDGWRREEREGSSEGGSEGPVLERRSRAEPDLEQPAIKRGATRDLSGLLLAGVPPAAVLLYLPYYLRMATTGFLGIFPVTAPSDPREFLLVHGFFLAVFIVYGAVAVFRRRPLLLVPVFLPAVLLAAAGYPAAALAVAAGTALLAKWVLDPGYRRSDGSEGAGAVQGGLGPLWTREGGPSGHDPEILFALAGIVIISFVEFFYLKDYLGGIYYRMNTVFKFYNIAWILMGVSALVMVGRGLGRLKIPRISSGQAAAAGILAGIALALAIAAVFAAGTGGPYTLDGLRFVARDHPGDAAALPFVRSLPPGTIIAEGAKGDYGYPSRISAFTGVQTLIGWPGHEFMWRGAGARTSARIDEVRAVYEDPGRAPGILRQYGVDYVYVGETERELYDHLNLPLSDLLPVYEDHGVTIYRFTG